ncbi:MAG: sigma-54-dependent Fis family transcriptional regulator [Candidatus Hydrogenedentota bacterium]|nr:MAG: sigma-54-dependent Fis family transcriptional regulator [Candidatus Hydrogenedentota bacterium]
MPESKILLVDDEESARYGMRRALVSLGGEIIDATNGKEALEVARDEKPDLVIMDIAMPEMDGLEALEKLRQLSDPPLVIMVTAHGSERVAVDAMKKGAYDYIAKPYEVDELRIVARNALEKILLERENRRLAEELRKREAYGQIIGTSDAMRQVFDRIAKVCQTDVAVLIEGESGTGKELVANEIHRRSHRRNGPFVIMNCAALPENLIESELFGHEKGAFTGATAQRRGKFEVADGGTLFLDEIGDMSLNTQAKVLRVLEEQKFERLGGEKTIGVDVRIISATNKDLSAATKEGLFREDLYYRLKVVSMWLPPLRERRGDIVVLTNYLVEMFSQKHNKKIVDIDPGAIRVVHAYQWPGNVRELRNALESAVVLASGNRLKKDDLPPEIQKQSLGLLADALSIDDNLPFREWKKQMVETAERQYLVRKLEENDHNISRTARVLDMHRQSLQQKLRELGIDVRELQE